MKIFLKTLFIFLFFVFLHGLSGTVSANNLVQTDFAINNVSSKTATISESLRYSEFFTSEDGTQNLNSGKDSNTCPSSFLNNQIRNINSNTYLSIIHNLSSCLKTEIKIRAP